ncbi:MAG: helix-turn-helix transcriptional regulator [Bacteroidetes bacterium]|nr:helix-turn-helix transcriptional regulator [Bacteroidota bacterium]
MKAEDTLSKIEQNITAIRKQKGLTSNELGYVCDIDKSALIHIEKGRINVTIKTLHKIASVLDVEIIEFLK